MWDYVKRPNLRLIGVPEGDDQAEKHSSGYYPEELPNLERQANIQIQEIQRRSLRYSSRRATTRHISI